MGSAAIVGVVYLERGNIRHPLILSLSEDERDHWISMLYGSEKALAVRLNPRASRLSSLPVLIP